MTNPVHRKYSRHRDICRHYVRELALASVIKLVPLGTRYMVADDLTKSLPAPALVRHRKVMMGHQRFQPFYTPHRTQLVHLLGLHDIAYGYSNDATAPISHGGKRLVIGRN